MTERQTRFTLSPEDYIAAQKLHLRRQFRRPRMLAIFAVFGALALAGVLLPTADPVLNRIKIVAGLVLLALPVANYFLFVPRHTRKLFAQQKTLHAPIAAQWSAQGYDASNATTGGTIAWGDYHQWADDEDIVLLYQSDALFQMIPRRALNDDQLADMRALARAAGLKGA